MFDDLLVLMRIAKRGRSYYAERRDSHGVDLFQHFEDELGRLLLAQYPERWKAYNRLRR